MNSLATTPLRQQQYSSPTHRVLLSGAVGEGSPAPGQPSMIPITISIEETVKINAQSVNAMIEFLNPVNNETADNVIQRRPNDPAKFPRLGLPDTIQSHDPRNSRHLDHRLALRHADSRAQLNTSLPAGRDEREPEEEVFRKLARGFLQ